MKMKFSIFCPFSVVVLILFTFYGEVSLDSTCGNSWHAFKDEKCFHIVDDITRTFADAEKACTKLENAPTLAVIHTQEEQEFLSSFLFNISKKLENFWLGAKVVNSKVAWIDNSELGYTNWDTRNLAPRNKPNYCVQMEYDEAVVGKWIDEPCETKNLVVCQKMQTLTLEKLNKMYLELRKKSRDALDEANKQIDNLKQMLESEKASSSKNVADLKQNLLPIGFIYSQLPNEKSPSEIWPSMTWTDVSATYAGVFFRVNGGGSESFGQIQAENAPRIVKVERSINSPFNSNDTLNVNSVSAGVYTGDDAKEFNHQIKLLFITSGGEIRPRNMAIRVWKRTG